MFGLGLPEILLIGVLVLIFVGPDQLPTFLRTAGKYYGQLRRASDELRQAFTIEADRMEAEERYQKLQERRLAAEEARKKAMAATPGVIPQEPPAPPSSLTAAAPPSSLTAAAPLAPERATLPAGVSPEEWETLPEHIRELLRSKGTS